jgi:hypothetical protein
MIQKYQIYEAVVQHNCLEKSFLKTVDDEKSRNPDLVLVVFQKVLNPESSQEIH